MYALVEVTAFGQLGIEVIHRVDLLPRQQDRIIGQGFAADPANEGKITSRRPGDPERVVIRLRRSERSMMVLAKDIK